MKQTKVPMWKQPIVTIPLKIGKIMLLLVMWIGKKSWELSSAFAKGSRRYWDRKYRKWD